MFEDDIRDNPLKTLAILEKEDFDNKKANLEKRGYKIIEKINSYDFSGFIIEKDGKTTKESIYYKD